MDNTKWKYITVLIFTFCYFVVELAVGLYAGSLILQADAYHMLSDAIALLVGLTAHLYSRRDRDSYYTFGWLRTEVVGGLINGVFLIAICFNLLISSIISLSSWNLAPAVAATRLAQINMVLITAAVGLVVNFSSLLIFHPSHHDHSRAHGHHEHQGQQAPAQQEGVASPSKKHNLNHFGVWLHLCGDLLNSFLVIISCLLIKYLDSPYRWLSDPLFTILVVIIIAMASFRNFRTCLLILLHRNPASATTAELLTTIKAIPSIKGVHDLHIWSLNQEIHVASLHVTIDIENYFEAAGIIQAVKQELHQHGVHTSTVELETSDHCSEPTCGPHCRQYHCCGSLAVVVAVGEESSEDGSMSSTVPVVSTFSGSSEAATAFTTPPSTPGEV